MLLRLHNISRLMRWIVNVSLSYNSPMASRTVSVYVDTEQVGDSEH